MDVSDVLISALQAKSVYSDYNEFHTFGIQRTLNWVSNESLTPIQAANVMYNVCNGGDEFEGLRRLDPNYRVFLARLGSPAMYIQTNKKLTGEEEYGLLKLLNADDICYLQHPAWQVDSMGGYHLGTHNPNFFQTIKILPGSGYRLWWD